MGCVNCGGSMENSTNALEFSELISLFENPLNVEVSDPFLVYYKKWHIQAKVAYDEVDEEGTPTGERVEKIVKLGEIN